MLNRATLILNLLLALTINASGQTNLKPGSLEAKALAFFAQIEDHSFDDYLKRVRLPQVSAAFKAEVLARLTRGEEVAASAGQQSMLAALEPLLHYHERAAVIEIKVIRARGAFIIFQGRAALLITETALNLLSVEELQAVVAHELGHEYFWGELMEARQRKDRELLREIELRCDGLAVIALRRLKLDPNKLLSAISKIRMINARILSTDPLYHPMPDERARFIRALGELIKQKQAWSSGFSLSARN